MRISFGSRNGNFLLANFELYGLRFGAVIRLLNGLKNDFHLFLPHFVHHRLNTQMNAYGDAHYNGAVHSRFNIFIVIFNISMNFDFI